MDRTAKKVESTVKDRTYAGAAQKAIARALQDNPGYVPFIVSLEHGSMAMGYGVRNGVIFITPIMERPKKTDSEKNPYEKNLFFTMATHKGQQAKLSVCRTKIEHLHLNNRPPGILVVRELIFAGDGLPDTVHIIELTRAEKSNLTNGMFRRFENTEFEHCIEVSADEWPYYNNESVHYITLINDHLLGKWSIFPVLGEWNTDTHTRRDSKFIFRFEHLNDAIKFKLYL